MSSIEDHSMFSVGAAPVSEAAPCGENARYDSDFEQLEAELAKQESLAAETVDWQRVIDLSDKILREQSKDILVGSYLCYGLLLQEGYSGLAVGLKVLADMVDQHWDCLFPPAKRLRARQTAFVWMAEKSGLIVAEKPPTAEETDAVLAAADFLKQLDQALVEKMGDQAPMFSDLSRPLKNFRQSAQAEKEKAEQQAEPDSPPQAQAVPQADATEQTPAETAPAATELASASAPEPPAPQPSAPAKPAKSAVSSKPVEIGDLASENDSKKALRQIQQGSRDIAAFWLAQKLSDPRPYRLARQAVWLSVEKAPPDNDGVTQIAAPQAERVKFFHSKFDKGEYSELLLELEKTLARSAFWLDGHFLVVKSLRALGADYGKAAQTVVRELGCFLQRIPEVVELSFADQTPFADDATRLWINGEVLAASDTSADTGPAASADSPWESALADARSQAASGDSVSAIGLMQQGLSQAGSLRAQMYWRCALAQLLLQTGEAATAAAILEAIRKQVDEDFLSGWEPQLLAKIYHLLFQCYLKLGGKKKDDETLNSKRDKAYRKLCRFDPVTALSEKGG